MFAIKGLDKIKMDKGLILNYVTQLALGKGTGIMSGSRLRSERHYGEEGRL